MEYREDTMRITYFVCIAMVVSTALYADVFRSESFEGIDAAIEKNPRAALTKIDQGLTDIGTDWNNIPRKYAAMAGNSPNERAAEESSLQTWENYLTTLRKRAQQALHFETKAGRFEPVSAMGTR
jgi:hypothetical protein